MTAQVQLRRDTAANWLLADPVLADGEMGIDLTVSKVKIGDGTTTWSQLPYQDELFLSRMKNYSEVVHDNGSSGTSLVIDMKNGNVQKAKLTANCTITIINAAPADFTTNLTLWLTQDITGYRTVTLPALLNVMPGVNSLSNALTVLNLTTITGGAPWLGTKVL